MIENAMYLNFKKAVFFNIVNRKNLINLPKKSKYELIFPIPLTTEFLFFLDPCCKLLINYLHN